MAELTREEQTALINKLNNLQASLAIVDELIKNSSGSTVLATERHTLLEQIDKLHSTIGFHFQAKDAKQPRAQI